MLGLSANLNYTCLTVMLICGKEFSDYVRA